MCFSVLEYEKSDDKLFSSYIAEFMAAKIHASDFDDGIKGNAEEEAKFIQACYDKYGITIDPSKMCLNKGRRSLAKLALNNLWGRFALRNVGLAQCLITDDPAELAKMLDNKAIDVTALDELDKNSILITYEKKKEFVEEHPSSNIGW